MSCKSCNHADHLVPCWKHCPECRSNPADDERVVRERKPSPKVEGPKPKVQSGGTQVERNRRWRQKNREKYNEYMRRYRAREK